MGHNINCIHYIFISINTSTITHLDLNLIFNEKSYILSLFFTICFYKLFTEQNVKVFFFLSLQKRKLV